MSGASPEKRRLVTERDVARLPAGARLELERDALVTPAARDLACARGIRLEVEGGSAAAAAAPETSAGWPKLEDGEWLVEVRGGKVRARRIAPPS
jgi:hypothetical protein